MRLGEFIDNATMEVERIASLIKGNRKNKEWLKSRKRRLFRLIKVFSDYKHRFEMVEILAKQKLNILDAIMEG